MALKKFSTSQGALLVGRLTPFSKENFNHVIMTAKPKSFSELISGPKPVLVDFYATWCGPCQMMQPILEDVSKQVGTLAKVIKVDVDKNPAAANQYQVRGVPTLILFQNGKPLWRQSGVVPAHQLVNIVRQHAQQAGG